MNRSHAVQRGEARTKRPRRDQVEMQFFSLDQLLDKEHRARIVWEYAESVDLSELYGRIKAVEGEVGRDAIDPRILFALWLLATIEGLTSARRLADLTERDIPYMWICGGVSVNYHRLSDFRTDHGDLLEQVLVDSIGVLLHQKLITLDRVAQDGMRVRASAGGGSFRREGSLEQALREATAHVEQLQNQQERDPVGDDRRRRGARERVAKERQQRIEQARAELEKLKAGRQQRKSQAKSELRASTTDPEARRMKMGDGGFRPAYNVQFCSEGESRLIVGLDVTNQGTDSGLMGPMHQQLVENYATPPREYLVDGGFTKTDDITQLEQAGTEVYAPVFQEQQQLAQGKDPYAKKRDDTPEMAAFRKRMGTPEAKALYQQRPGIAEFPNAGCRNRGLTQFRVRGLVKVKAQTLWQVLAHNFLRMLNRGYLETVLQH